MFNGSTAVLGVEIEIASDVHMETGSLQKGCQQLVEFLNGTADALDTLLDRKSEILNSVRVCDRVLG